MTGLLPVALEWLAAGYAPLPIGMAEKHPCVRWKAYQAEAPAEADVRAWFSNGSGAGLGAACGYGGLDMFELEGTAVAEGKLREFTDELAARGLAPLWRRIAIGYSEQSPSGGIHVCYRVSDGEVPHNTPLARRPETQAELDAREMTKVEARKGVKKPRPVVQIETRGTGGFTVLAPTVKGDGRGWVLLSGGPRTLAEVTTAEREALYAAARACDTYTAWKAAQKPAAASGTIIRNQDNGPAPALPEKERATFINGAAEAPSGPLAHAPWAEILAPAGWVHVTDDDQGHQLWRRPGKAEGWSASTSESGGLYVFSSSTDFDTEVPYSRAAAVAVLYEDMDAAEALAKFGTPAESRRAAQDFTMPSGRAPDADKPPEAENPEAGGPSSDHPFLDDGEADKWARSRGGYVVPGPGGGVLAMVLGNDIATMGPLASGGDNRMWRYSRGVWIPAPNVMRDRAVRLLRNDYRPGYAKAAGDVVAAFAPVIDSEPVEQYINVRNGLLDWRTGGLCDHTPDVLSTVQLGCEWQPGAACPWFDWWLPQVVPPDCIELAWELIGYLAYSGNPLHTAVMLVGSGRNGKGTLLRVILAILGKANTSSASLADLVSTRFTTATLFGKTANLAGDIDATYLENTAVLKAITGMDQIQAEHKNCPRFDFTPWAVPVFSANKIPASADTTAGYLSRWLVIPFPNSFAGREDRTIEAKLHAELPGILAGGVRRLPALLKRGQFSLGDSARDAKDDFARRVDQVRYWLHECCEVRGDLSAVSRTQLYGSYKRWVFRDGGKALGAGEFYNRLESIGFAYTRNAAGRWFYGVRVTDECHPSASDYLQR